MYLSSDFNRFQYTFFIEKKRYIIHSMSCRTVFRLFKVTLVFIIYHNNISSYLVPIISTNLRHGPNTHVCEKIVFCLYCYLSLLYNIVQNNEVILKFEVIISNFQQSI